MEPEVKSRFLPSLLQKDIACLSRKGGLFFFFPQRTYEMYNFILNSVFTVFSATRLYTHRFWGFFSQLFLCYWGESYVNILSGILWYI